MIVSWPPKLTVTWPSFEMRNNLGEAVETFPNELWIPFLDNERHVLRTMGERIELRQPVDVSRLYPSLPDLREKMIERTQTDRV